MKRDLIVPVLTFVFCINTIIAQDFFSDRLLVKVKDQYRSSCSSGNIDLPILNEIISGKGVVISQKFPEEKIFHQKRFSSNEVDLSLIFEFKFSTDIEVIKWVNRLHKTDLFEYVEPKYIHRVEYTPNDPDISQQDYLTIISAFDAWDVQRANSSITVGIIDTGTDLDHPELISKLKTNPNDPINGVDDDNDGYVDNFQGWDFTTNDNDPSVTFNDHGVTVSGAAVASADNAEGIAGVGFDCSYLPVKVGEYTAITEGYEGIKYAADMGVDIINCSWGGFNASAFEQDIITYAAITKNCLILAAAGNQNQVDKYYPASYDYVVGVAATNDNDTKASFSNYGFWVDISAPGDDIYSTANNGAYRVEDGTSLACPLVAGAAALVKAEYPSLSGVQIGERLKQTADNIDSANPTYLNQLGFGRLNVAASLNGTINSPAIVLAEQTLTDNNDNAFKIGDTVDYLAKFTNFLSGSGNLVATLTTSSSHVTLVNNTFNIGVLAMLGSADNHLQPFQFKIENTAPKNEMVEFVLTVSDGAYTQNFREIVYINVDYLNIEENNIGLTVTSKSLLGYNLKDQKQGIGARLNGGESLLFEGGLMVGAIPNTIGVVVDNIRNTGTLSDANFSSSVEIRPTIPSADAVFEAQTSFVDTLSFSDKLQLEIKQKVRVWDEPGHQNYIVLDYTIINLRAESQNNVFAGLLTDFDVPNYERNKFGTNFQRFIGYSYSTDSNTPVAGIQLLSNHPANYYGIDNVIGGNGGVDIRNGFFSDDKYTVLSTSRYTAGDVAASGNDVLQSVSANIGSIASGDSAMVSFALILANDTNELFAAADSAYQKVNSTLPNSITEINQSNGLEIFPNPIQHGQLQFKLIGPDQINQVEIVSMSGQVVFSEAIGFSGVNTINIEHLPKGIYWLKCQTTKDQFILSFVK